MCDKFYSYSYVVSFGYWSNWLIEITPWPTVSRCDAPGHLVFWCGFLTTES